MESQVKDDGEDIPSDFFDDFNKEEFIEGLSVIDSWDDDAKGPRPRIDSEAVESVKDLRELIRDGKSEKTDRDRHSNSTRSRKSRSIELDDFIKPGSRRDPNKTNEAIRRDKNAKVKEFLAKSLESADDIRPPGTELDDFFDDMKTSVRKEEKPKRSRSPVVRNKSRERRRESPRKHRPSPPLQRRRESPSRRYPLQKRRSPTRRSPVRRSPARRSPIRRSPARRSPARRSPARRSPRRSPRRQRRSRSPYRRSPNRRSPNYRRNSPKDSFLYPDSRSKPKSDYTGAPEQSWDVGNIPLPTGDFVPPPPMYFSNAGPPPGMSFSGYNPPYDYGPPPVGPPLAPPVGYIPPVGPPLPVPAPVPAPVVGPSAVGPPMVPAPQLPSPSLSASSQDTTSGKKTPYDALGQLLADGKISKEDYLKLTPKKSASIPGPMDLKEKVELLNRCHEAVTKLNKLHLPNRLVMPSNLAGQEPKTIAPKFCSPLKRQPAVEFHFTQAARASATQQNKQLVDSIVATIGLDKVVPRLKKKEPKNMKDAAVQTTKPHCDVCTIRESTKFYEAATSTEPEYFTKTVHTQVLEQDLASSRAVFNPSGGPSDSAPISIAHLTPAQLVSQLAARAKTLQSQPAADPSQFMRRNPNYDYDNRGGNQYQNNSYNYRY